jgi:diaminopimelate decarboxylase
LDAKVLAVAQSHAIDAAMEIAATSGLSPKFVNIGGGFGIPCFEGDDPLAIEAVGTAMRSSLAPLFQSLPQTSVILELGRYLVGECGHYVCRVVDRKQIGNDTFIVTDGGLHQHLMACISPLLLPHQSGRRNYRIIIPEKLGSSQPIEMVNVVGRLCTGLDRIADSIVLPRTEIGDLLVVMNSGAYALNSSPTNFLNHPLPVELLVGREQKKGEITSLIKA